MTKICIKCGIEKPKIEFYPSNSTSDHRTDKCKECYIKEKEEKAHFLAGKDGKKEGAAPIRILGAWAKGQKSFCPSPTSSCWLSYHKGLCCCECKGRDICNLPDKCKNNVDACLKWFRRKY